MTFSISTRIASRLDHVWLLREALAGILGHHDLAESEIGMMQLALTEIVNNSIEHGYHRDPTGIVEVDITLKGTHLELDIFDDAEAMPAGTLQTLLEAADTSDDDSREDWPERGHGLKIIRMIVDQVSVQHVNGRNHVQVRKQLSYAAS